MLRGGIALPTGVPIGVEGRHFLPQGRSSVLWAAFGSQRHLLVPRGGITLPSRPSMLRREAFLPLRGASHCMAQHNHPNKRRSLVLMGGISIPQTPSFVLGASLSPWGRPSVSRGSNIRHIGALHPVFFLQWRCYGGSMCLNEVSFIL